MPHRDIRIYLHLVNRTVSVKGEYYDFATAVEY